MYNKTLIIQAVLILLFQGLFSEGQFESGFVQRNYAFRDFDSLAVDGALRVRIIKSENWDIHISSSREDISSIKLRKNNNVFEISRKVDSPVISPSPVIIISMPELVAISLSGIVQMEAGGFSSDLNLEVNMGPGTFLNLSGFESSHAEFIMNGPCKLHAFMSARTIEVHSNGSASVRMGGRAINLNLQAHGQARFDGSLLLVDNVNMELTGLSEIRITPDVRMEISSSDEAIIYYSDKYMDEQPITEGNAILRKF